MGQRIDVNHLNIYYGDFLAVEDVNINIEANKVTAFIAATGSMSLPYRFLPSSSTSPSQ